MLGCDINGDFQSKTFLEKTFLSLWSERRFYD
jgi:hypothetical protein